MAERRTEQLVMEALFLSLRPKLLRAAYRMLGSIADAEDIVQETFIRWLRADLSGVEEPEAYLRSIVLRLCLDHIGSARSRRESYVGLWLPDPVFDGAFDETDEITLPLMVALDRLTPLERAAFLLHDVFGLSFVEVAQTIERDPVSCRQLASRARVHIRAERTRFHTPRQRALELAEAFFVASRKGDMDKLKSMLAADVSVYADGGGKAATLTAVITGIDKTLSLHTVLARLFNRSRSQLVRYAFINGLPGFVTVEQSRTLQTTALYVANDRIAAIYVTRNPEKLRHIASTETRKGSVCE